MNINYRKILKRGLIPLAGISFLFLYNLLAGNVHVVWHYIVIFCVMYGFSSLVINK